jgi:glycosyltransferase involved in cell wall biosynthesis
MIASRERTAVGRAEEPRHGADASGDQAARRLQDDLAAFERIVARARDYYERGRFTGATAHAQAAATHAFWMHPGLFASPALESILLGIGRAQVPAAPRARTAGNAERRPQRVLHVTTKALGIGGHTRMLWRWIEQDANRSHSVVLTRQGAERVPQPLLDAVDARGGRVHTLNQRAGNVITWARRLRRIAAQADLVVLHIYCDDVVALLAFADRRHRPPVIFLDHADHAFWLGAGVSDVVVALRDTGRQLAQQRRGIEEGRSALLPIVLTPSERTLSRAEAKCALGLAEDSVVLLSIARGHKYQPIGGTTYAESIVPVLAQHERAVLLVVGPDHDREWAAASERVQGRVRAFGPREDTAVFYQAADIYLDSYPVVSTTSLLEAGSYGVPLLSRCLHTGDHSVLCADAPGLTGRLIRTRDPDEFHTVLSGLIEDEALRETIGEETRAKILEVHSAAAWQQALEGVYEQAASVPPVDVTDGAVDRASAEETDRLWSLLFRNEVTTHQVMQYFIREMPLDLRLATWLRLAVRSRTFRPNLLMSDWMVVRLRQWLSAGAMTMRNALSPRRSRTEGI